MLTNLIIIAIVAIQTIVPIWVTVRQKLKIIELLRLG